MKQNKTNLLLAVILILAAAISKVITYPHTFDPIIGMALFSGAVVKDKRFAFVLPIFAMLLSDIMLEASGIGQGFYGWSQLVNYGVLALVTVFGFRLKKINVKNVVGFSLISSAIFFVLSNLGFFIIDNPVYHTYPNTVGGFIACYVKAIPFFKWYVDLAFSGILFGSYYLITTYAMNNKQAAV
ncbi:MAG: DUF6580 family putative transport protein [Ferruginibacter sp.]